MSSTSAADGAPKSASGLTRLLDSPLVGFAPWIALSLLEGPGRTALASSVALAMSVVFALIDRIRGKSLKLLSVVDIVAFAAFLAIGTSISPSSQHWLETWFGELANIVLVLVVVGSIAGRMPFTIQYAREEVDREDWDAPLFIHINYVLTAVWGLSFLFAAIVGFYGDAVLHNNSNLWTAWILQIGAYLVAVEFTSWYPDRATALSLQEAGEPTEPPPPVAALLISVAGFLTPVGIIVLAADGGPTWLGIVLIVAGPVIAGRLRQTMTAGANEATA